MRRLALTFILALLFFKFHLLIFGHAGSSLLLWLSLVMESGGYSLVAVLGLLLLWNIGFQALKLKITSCDRQAQLLRGTWDLPLSGIEPMSPALADGFFTPEPRGKLHPSPS